MGWLVVVLGLGWLAYQLIKDACIKDVTKDYIIDWDKAFIDSSSGKYSKKELNKRMNNGYYNKKKK